MKRDDRKEKLNTLYTLRYKYYILPYIDEEEVENAIIYVKHVKRFFIKLHKNKDINVNLLVNHLVYLFNCFQREYIIRYMMFYVNPEHLIYLKTILLYMCKITIDNEWFKDISISYDFDYLLKTINRRYIHD